MSRKRPCPPGGNDGHVSAFRSKSLKYYQLPHMFPADHEDILRKVFANEPMFPKVFDRLLAEPYHPGLKTDFRGPALEIEILYLAALLNWLAAMPSKIFPPTFAQMSKDAPQPTDLLQRLARAAPDLIELHSASTPIRADCAAQAIHHHVRWYVWTEGMERMQVWALSDCGQGTTFVKRYGDRVFHIGSRANSLDLNCTCGQLDVPETKPFEFAR